MVIVWSKVKVCADEKERVVLVKAGQDFSVALTDQGRIYSWGSGAWQGLGHGDEKDVYDTPHAPPLKTRCSLWLICLVFVWKAGSPS